MWKKLWDADGELGDGGDRDKAAEAQGRALDALKKGWIVSRNRCRTMASRPIRRGPWRRSRKRRTDGQGPEEADPLGRPTNRDPRHNPRAGTTLLGSSPVSSCPAGSRGTAQEAWMTSPVRKRNSTIWSA